MSVSDATERRHEEALAAWILARRRAPLLRERVRLVREAGGSFLSALLRLDGGPNGFERERPAAERSLEAIHGRGFRLLLLTDPSYPRLLAEITDPPLVLTLWGRLPSGDELGLAIVGSRRATPYGLDTARRLARELASAGLTIVSGLARGIDGAAHRGALDASGRTIAVLGSGLGHIYPREHRRLADRIAETGAVISEFDLIDPPSARNFPRRNRVITGLTLGTLVVEAATKSGSLISARHALEQDREVFAVPGPISSPTSEGVHALLRDGARLVSRASDVLEELQPEVREALAATVSAGGSVEEDRHRDQTRPGELDEDERAILGRLSGRTRPLDVDEILEPLDLPVDRAFAALGALEVKGRIASLPGGLYRIRT